MTAHAGPNRQAKQRDESPSKKKKSQTVTSKTHPISMRTAQDDNRRMVLKSEICTKGVDLNGLWRNSGWWKKQYRLIVSLESWKKKNKPEWGRSGEVNRHGAQK